MQKSSKINIFWTIDICFIINLLAWIYIIKKNITYIMPYVLIYAMITWNYLLVFNGLWKRAADINLMLVLPRLLNWLLKIVLTFVHAVFLANKILNTGLSYVLLLMKSVVQNQIKLKESVNFLIIICPLTIIIIFLII